MASLFRATQLEIRFPLNMNVLTADRTPLVLGLRDVLRHWLDHRHEVLQRRSRHRLAAIERRLEILDGFLAVFLNIDEVIRIIRHEDEPKPALMAAFSLSDVQAEAILNMRLRSLRRLEEMEIRREHKTLTSEARDLRKLLGSERLRWERIEEELEETRRKFGDGDLGRRRTTIAGAPDEVAVSVEAFVEREPITVVLSRQGWLRAVRGHVGADAELRFKEGDALNALLPCQTSDRLCLLATDGRVFTLRAGELPRGRGDGQAVRVLVEMGAQDEVAALFVLRDGARYLLASDAGRGFVAQSEALLAEKRTGKQVLNLKPGERALLCAPAEGDHLAVVGTNRRLLVFPLAQVPVMARGQGVALQKYKDGKLADAIGFWLADGLSWPLGERVRTEANVGPWLGERGQAGRMVPNGFPRSGRFSG
jgi:topoisomerase-4 subunit A